MTEAVQFFQSFFLFRSFSSIGIDRHEIRLANELKKDAQKLAALAEAEFINGKTAQTVVFGEKSENNRRNLAEIATWHFGRSVDAYRRAIARFEEAAKLRTAKQKDFSNKAKKMMEHAAQIETDIDCLNQFLSNF